MCLAIPGKLVEIIAHPSGIKMGKANFGGIVKQVCLEYTPEAKMGDYVLVHVGFALSTIDEAEAKRSYDLLKEMSQLDELDIPDVAESAPLYSYHPAVAGKADTLVAALRPLSQSSLEKSPDALTRN